MHLTVAILITLLLAVFSYSGSASWFKSINVPKATVSQTLPPKDAKPAAKTAPAATKQANILFGKAVHVSDGDTLTVQVDSGEKLKIRMYAIDAPEKAQPYGPQATGILKKLVLNEKVKLEVINTDRYGRKVARVYIGKQDINAEMLKLGAAWHYKVYDKSRSYQEYASLETTAKNNKKGLWNKQSPTPPWDYRKALREQKK